MTQQPALDIEKGFILNVDKPLGWSSFHVVKKLRGAFLARLRSQGVRKLKVGHAGTLDPLASGVMVLCVGRATKNIDLLQSGVKEYIAQIQLGATTPSFDLETPVDATFPTAHITRSLILGTLPSFVGEISQIPPSYSACKIGGKRAYKLARQGQEVNLKPKTLVIDTIELLDFDPAAMRLTVKVVCSKGTYIRALARDIGIALGTGGHLTSLRRTRVGDCHIEGSLDIDSMVGRIFQSTLLLPQTHSTVPIEIAPQEVPAGFRSSSADPRDILPFNERQDANSQQDN